MCALSIIFTLLEPRDHNNDEDDYDHDGDVVLNDDYVEHDDSTHSA